ncbi:MAG TPA: prolipoprotein diacylglyceryl transferase [Haliangium sp.]|nr:prolipoprotein diacylglyceryl transferase [Haliangium sp.]
MKPTLFEIDLPVVGVLSFPAYMTMLMVGFLVAIWVARREAERQGMEGVAMVDLGLLVLVLGIVGARILSVLVDGHFMDFVHLCTEPTLVPAIDSRVAHCSADVACDLHYVCDLATNTCHPPRDCLAALKFWQGGLTFYGGLLLAIPGGIWFVRRRRLDIGRVADIAAPCTMLGLFFGRLGCFLNGCCYGVPTASWPGVEFPGHLGPVHPTQLYEAAGALVLAVALYAAMRRRTAGGAAGRGEMFGWMLVGYGILRAVLEIYRADPRGGLGPLSTSQIISIPLIAIGAVVIARARRRARAEAESAAAGPAGGGSVRTSDQPDPPSTPA